jgi:hypothetical protein
MEEYSRIHKNVAEQVNLSVRFVSWRGLLSCVLMKNTCKSSAAPLKQLTGNSYHLRSSYALPVGISGGEGLNALKVGWPIII